MAIPAVGRSIIAIGARADRRAGAVVVGRVPLALGHSDRRGVRSGRPGHAPHVERALQVRADRRGRPPARTTTRTPVWRPWSSRESHVWRGVGVHRFCREGPDWPVLPCPSPDASLSLPAVPMPAIRRVAPAPAGSTSVPSAAELVLSRCASCLTAPGAEIRRRRENDLTLRPQQLECKHIAYDIVYMSHLTGRCTLIRTHWVRLVPRLGSSGERHDR